MASSDLINYPFLGASLQRTFSRKYMRDRLAKIGLTATDEALDYIRLGFGMVLLQVIMDSIDVAVQSCAAGLTTEHVNRAFQLLPRCYQKLFEESWLQTDINERYGITSSTFNLHERSQPPTHIRQNQAENFQDFPEDENEQAQQQSQPSQRFGPQPSRQFNNRSVENVHFNQDPAPGQQFGQQDDENDLRQPTVIRNQYRREWSQIMSRQPPMPLEDEQDEQQYGNQQYSNQQFGGNQQYSNQQFGGNQQYSNQQLYGGQPSRQAFAQPSQQQSARYGGYGQQQYGQQQYGQQLSQQFGPQPSNQSYGNRQTSFYQQPSQVQAAPSRTHTKESLGVTNPPNIAANTEVIRKFFNRSQQRNVEFAQTFIRDVKSYPRIEPEIVEQVALRATEQIRRQNPQLATVIAQQINQHLTQPQDPQTFQRQIQGVAKAFAEQPDAEEAQEQIKLVLSYLGAEAQEIPQKKEQQNPQQRATQLSYELVQHFSHQLIQQVFYLQMQKEGPEIAQEFSNLVRQVSQARQQQQASNIGQQSKIQQRRQQASTTQKPNEQKSAQDPEQLRRQRQLAALENEELDNEYRPSSTYYSAPESWRNGQYGTVQQEAPGKATVPRQNQQTSNAELMGRKNQQPSTSSKKSVQSSPSRLHSAPLRSGDSVESVVTAEVAVDPNAQELGPAF